MFANALKKLFHGTAKPDPKETIFTIDLDESQREWLKLHLKEYEFKSISFKDSLASHHNRIQSALHPKFVISGVREPGDLHEYANQHSIPVIRVADFAPECPAAELPRPKETVFTIDIDESGREWLKNHFADLDFHSIPFRDLVSKHHDRIQSSFKPRFVVSGIRSPEDIEEYAKQHAIDVIPLQDFAPECPFQQLPIEEPTPEIRSGEKSPQKKSPQKPVYPDIPEWYQPHPSDELLKSFDSGLPTFLYIPWIAEHGNVLVSKIQEKNSFQLVPFDVFIGISENEVRRNVIGFSRKYPQVYRRMIARRLVPLRNQIAGIVFTFDWPPSMRIIASVCEELGIPRILIPHESVFVDREKYYWDPYAYASTPSADIVLAWGRMQKEIYVERGYPAERVHCVGAPKFDAYYRYKPQLAREQFCRLFGLNPAKRIVLFASQPLDSQLDTKTARKSQQQAIRDLLALANQFHYQLIVRLPPSKDDILGSELRSEMNAMSHAVIDDAECYLVAPEEAIFHSALVTSINSTMLFEGLLMGRGALSLKYVDFDQIWEKAGIPAVRSKSELPEALEALFAPNYEPPAEGMAWAADMFGIGSFDGRACSRIRAQLKRISQQGLEMGMRPSALNRLFARQPLDVIATTILQEKSSESLRMLTKLLDSRICVDSSGSDKDLVPLASADLFFQWGIDGNSASLVQQSTAKALGRPIVIVERGFLHSQGSPPINGLGLSIILDDTTAYYDATKVSRLQCLLQDAPALTPEQLLRSRQAITRIVKGRISTYNHAPSVPLKIGAPERKKILLLDQKIGDPAVTHGLSAESTFQRMLQDAIHERPDCDIIIKQFTSKENTQSKGYFTEERLAFAQYTDNLFVINFEINPYSLFDLVDEVYTVTSDTGFEALMAGKIVHCYGMPFYAGWGLTRDKIFLEGRTRKRSLEEVFYFAYIESSRYLHPDLQERVELEELLDCIIKSTQSPPVCVETSNVTLENKAEDLQNGEHLIDIVATSESRTDG